MLRNGLYLITPDEPDPLHLVARVQPLLPFASCLQFRNKAMPAATLREAGTLLRDACSDAGVLFIVNDDAALALELGAGGVHLGEDDGDIYSARMLLGDACPSYPSDAPARYVLELNAGEAERLGLKDGAEMRFSPDIPQAK